MKTRALRPIMEIGATWVTFVGFIFPWGITATYLKETGGKTIWTLKSFMAFGGTDTFQRQSCMPI